MTGASRNWASKLQLNQVLSGFGSLDGTRSIAEELLPMYLVRTLNNHAASRIEIHFVKFEFSKEYPLL
jgi:hypothetical protein